MVRNSAGFIQPPILGFSHGANMVRDRAVFIQPPIWLIQPPIWSFSRRFG